MQPASELHAAFTINGPKLVAFLVAVATDKAITARSSFDHEGNAGGTLLLGLVAGPAYPYRAAVNGARTRASTMPAGQQAMAFSNGLSKRAI
jgi:hypothetical protein